MIILSELFGRLFLVFGKKSRGKFWNLITLVLLRMFNFPHIFNRKSQYPVQDAYLPSMGCVGGTIIRKIREKFPSFKL